MAKYKLENTLTDSQFTDRLLKRVDMLNKIVFNSQTDDESDSSDDQYDHHSHEDFEDELDEAWEQAWFESDDKELRCHSELKYPKYQCRLCKEVFVNFNKLKAHNLVHMVAPPYHCNLCLFYGNDKNTLKEHMKSHTENKPYECNRYHIKPPDSQGRSLRSDAPSWF